jgi:hypothetical protein
MSLSIAIWLYAGFEVILGDKDTVKLLRWMEKPNSKNLILEEIRNRIIQLLPLGLNRLYMNLDSDSDYFAATLLGYLPDDFDSMLQNSELTGVAKQYKYAVWTEKLRIFMAFRTSKEEGTRQHFFRPVIF